MRASIDSNSNTVPSFLLLPTTPAFMRVTRGWCVVQWGSGGANRLQTLTSYIGWSILAPPEPHCATLKPSCNPAGAMCDFLFFNPLETEFENVVLTKNVALAMFYHTVFENSEKVEYQAFYSHFRKTRIKHQSGQIFKVDF